MPRGDGLSGTDVPIAHCEACIGKTWGHACPGVEAAVTDIALAAHGATSCPACNRFVEPWWIFCPWCGMRL